MRSIAMLAVLVAGAALAGELSPDKALPLHENRDAYTPCAAFAKDTYLVAWQSGRLAPGDLREGYQFNGDIVGCRVGKDGNALDAQPFVICKAADLQERPRMAANKELALVVWQDLRNGKDWDVYAARIGSEGKVLDPDGFLVSGGPHNQASPRVAWDGKNFVVVWNDFRNGQKYAVFAARVSAEGKVLDPDGIKLPSSNQSCYDPSVASTADGRSFVFWCCYNYGDFSRGRPMAEGLFVADGKPGDVVHKEETRGDGKGQPGSGWGNSPTFMAAGKDKYILAWRNERPVGRGNGDPKTNAYIFDSQAKQGPMLALLGQPHRILSADLAWDGEAFVAAWTEWRTKDSRVYVAHEHVFASRLSTDGKVLGEAQLVAGSRSNPKGWGYGRETQGYKQFAGEREAPAMNPAVASDGAGTTLIAYEKHPDKAEVPIMIGYRMLTAK